MLFDLQASEWSDRDSFSILWIGLEIISGICCSKNIACMRTTTKYILKGELLYLKHFTR